MWPPTGVRSRRRAVLVGDPQQLPATVRSAKGRELDLERSLFERLQRAGVPVRMLAVQYRMHPCIRQFPSDHFYGGRLEDGCAVACSSMLSAEGPPAEHTWLREACLRGLLLGLHAEAKARTAAVPPKCLAGKPGGSTWQLHAITNFRGRQPSMHCSLER